MGGGAKYPYPKWVWSWSGGWWPLPKYGKVNTLMTAGIIAGVSAAAIVKGSELENRHFYPVRWIPSMLWSSEFHDPKSVAMWKEHLKREGRDWIEPYPEWLRDLLGSK